MDKLWAPWRMAYVGSAEPVPGCLFCTKAGESDDEGSHIVFRGPSCFVMLNLYPYNSGHLMVAPYQHTGKLVELSCGDELFQTMQLSIAAIDAAMHPEGYNVGFNQGKVAGAGVADHVHLHVVPRWNGDTNFMPVLADTKVIPELLATTAAKLRMQFERLAPTQ